MTNIIDVSITTLTSHHCTTPCSLVINFFYYPKKETRQRVLTHPYKAGGNTWAWYLDILEALFMRHEVANCKNEIRTMSKYSQTWDSVKNKQKNHMDQIQSGTHLFNTICSPPGFKTYMTHNSCSGWTPASFATKILAMEKEREFIPMHYRPIASHALQDSYSISTKRRS